MGNMKGMPTMTIPTPEQENKNSNGENTEDNTQAGGSSEESKQESEAAEKAKQEEAKLKKAEDELRESIPTYSVNPINSHLSTSQPFNPSHGQIITNPDTDM